MDPDLVLRSDDIRDILDDSEDIGDLSELEFDDEGSDIEVENGEISDNVLADIDSGSESELGVDLDEVRPISPDEVSIHSDSSVSNSDLPLAFRNKRPTWVRPR
uniref:Uncharacterized protein n=1 Tax=Graphocephala atropunctata TaxID=36148 RepID=A0A1B6KHB3_9HEMI